MKTGVIRADRAVSLFVAIVRVIAWLLIGLSLIGTFYSLLGKPMPLIEPWLLVFDIHDHWIIGVLAVALQGLLTVTQWASATLAKQANVLWWALYLLALAFSLWLNWSAYGDPLIALHTPYVLALLIVIGSDVAPEFALMLH